MAKLYKICIDCKENLPMSKYLKVSSDLFEDGTTPMCKDCLGKRIQRNNASFDYIDRLCQWIDVPFNVNKWLEAYEANGTDTFCKYVEAHLAKSYPRLNWKDTYLEYKALEEDLFGQIDKVKELRMEQLKEKWGEEYSPEDISYLENLLQGILQTQNVNGTLQMDDAIKLCKISLLLDEKIRGGEDFDKLLKSYDTLRKVADFTNKNTKNGCDFDSVGEVFGYLEKSGWINKFYDGATHDTVDITMKDIQSWIRNLYKNESSIPEDVERRVQALQIADSMEDTVFAAASDDLDDFDNDAYSFEEDFDEEAGT